MDIRTAPRALVLALLLASGIAAANEALVIQTDFGLKDGAVSAMKGVAFGVDRTLPLYDLTHEIPAYNIWEGAYRLYQTLQYWPKGTVFVSVVDPGVGTDRHSVVLKTKSGHYIVTPDNGTLTLVAEHFGIDAVPEKDGSLKGTIPILDVQYGNVWTNIDETLLTQVGVNKGDKACIKISEGDVVRYDGKAPYVSSFGDVPEGQPLVYLNSLLQVSVALNMDSFAAKHQVQSGANWHISLKKCS